MYDVAYDLKGIAAHIGGSGIWKAGTTTQFSGNFTSSFIRSSSSDVDIHWSISYYGKVGHWDRGKNNNEDCGIRSGSGVNSYLGTSGLKGVLILTSIDIGGSDYDLLEIGIILIVIPFVRLAFVELQFHGLGLLMVKNFMLVGRKYAEKSWRFF